MTGVLSAKNTYLESLLYVFDIVIKRAHYVWGGFYSILDVDMVDHQVFTEYGWTNEEDQN